MSGTAAVKTQKELRQREDAQDAVEDAKVKKEKKRKKNKEVEIPDDGVPYDRGWAWMIVVAGFINFVFAAGYNRAVFIFFVYFLDEFGAPVTETALLFGVKAGVNSIVGLFIMNAVVGRFGARRTVLMGGMCLSLSAILGSFARDITALILSQAVFHGLGMAMLNMPTTVLIGFYFRRRRSLANSIAKCGVGIGAVAFPPLVTFLLNQYGMRGALLLTGGICLNAVTSAMLLRPTSFYKKRHQQLHAMDESTKKLLVADEGKVNTDERKNESDENVIDRDNVRQRNTEVSIFSEINMNTHHHSKKEDVKLSELDLKMTDPACDLQSQENGHALQTHTILIEEIAPSFSRQNGNGKGPYTSIPPSDRDMAVLSKSAPALNHLRASDTHFRSRTFSEKEGHCFPEDYRYTDRKDGLLDAISRSSLVRYMSAPQLDHDFVCLSSSSDQPTSVPGQDSGEQSKCGACLISAWRLLKKIFGVLDFSLFKSPMFRLMVVYFLSSSMVNAVPTYLPAMCKERGLDDNQRATLLSIIGGLDFCCRLCCGFLADLRIVKVSTLIAVAFTILGIVCQLTRLLTTFPLLVALAVTQGMLGGVSACLIPILIMEDIGLDHTAKALGFAKLFSGASNAVFHPLLGYIRDSTGSYDLAYNVIGVLTLLSAAIMVCLRFLPHRLSEDSEQDGNHTAEGSSLLNTTVMESSPLKCDALKSSPLNSVVEESAALNSTESKLSPPSPSEEESFPINQDSSSETVCEGKRASS